MRPNSGPTKTPLFSVIVPTIGRKSLRRTLARLEREPDVEVIVVTDGPQQVAAGISRRFDVEFLEGPTTRRWGNAQRMCGIHAATGHYLLFIDDDDVHTANAFTAIRSAVGKSPDRIVVFRMNNLGRILWRERRVAHMNVSTQQLVIPNRPGKVGSWLTTDRYESDYDFLVECINLQGEPVWDEAVIAYSPQPPLLRARIRSKVALRTRLRRLRLTASRPRTP